MPVIQKSLQGHLFAIHRLRQWGNDLFAIDLHDFVKIVIPTGTSHNAGDFAGAHVPRKSLVIVNVSGQHEVGVAARLMNGIVQRLLHIAAAGMVVVG